MIQNEQQSNAEQLPPHLSVWQRQALIIATTPEKERYIEKLGRKYGSKNSINHFIKWMVHAGLVKKVKHGNRYLLHFINEGKELVKSLCQVHHILSEKLGPHYPEDFLNVTNTSSFFDEDSYMGLHEIAQALKQEEEE